MRSGWRRAPTSARPATSSTRTPPPRWRRCRWSCRSRQRPACCPRRCPRAGAPPWQPLCTTRCVPDLQPSAQRVHPGAGAAGRLATIRQRRREPQSGGAAGRLQLVTKPFSSSRCPLHFPCRNVSLDEQRRVLMKRRGSVVGRRSILKSFTLGPGAAARNGSRLAVEGVLDVRCEGRCRAGPCRGRASACCCPAPPPQRVHLLLLSL